MKAFETQPNVEMVHLDEHESALLADTVLDLESKLSDIDEAELLDKLAERGKQLGDKLPELSDKLQSFTAREGAKTLLINLVEQTTAVPPTPTQYPAPDMQDLRVPDLYRGALLGMAGLYGYGFETMQQGRIHNNIIPIKEHAEVVGHNASSSYELGLHNEVASFNITDTFNTSPDFLTLHFLRNERFVPTVISTYDIDELDEDTVEKLSAPWFVNHTSPGQGGTTNSVDVPVSILYGPANDPWSRISTSQLNLEEYDESQTHAIQEFVKHLVGRKIELPVKAGYLALIDNRRVLHGRPAYRDDQQPRYDGTDRWQRRITASTDKARIERFESRPRVVDMNIFRQQLRKALAENEPQL